jgi:hypothetical protein
MHYPNQLRVSARFSNLDMPYREGAVPFDMLVQSSTYAVSSLTLPPLEIIAMLQLSQPFS